MSYKYNEKWYNDDINTDNVHHEVLHIIHVHNYFVSLLIPKRIYLDFYIAKNPATRACKVVIVVLWVSIRGVSVVDIEKTPSNVHTYDGYLTIALRNQPGLFE